ncbi:MAG: hypothetical protein EBR05_10790 [Marivivens sp.]|nr:hypothetical protein [Marivivens sp.]NDH03529.1 hypothetical protein [Marivivens sp.]
MNRSKCAEIPNIFIKMRGTFAEYFGKWLKIREEISSDLKDSVIKFQMGKFTAIYLQKGVMV